MVLRPGHIHWRTGLGVVAAFEKAGPRFPPMGYLPFRPAKLQEAGVIRSAWCDGGGWIFRCSPTADPSPVGAEVVEVSGKTDLDLAGGPEC